MWVLINDKKEELNYIFAKAFIDIINDRTWNWIIF
jgi:hypothetical protein